VNATRAKSKQDLVDLVTARFKRAHAFGIRLQEAKSGYGLSFKDEIKSLETIHLAAKRIKGFQVLATCLAAHSVPKEWAHDRDGWINEICGRILPAVKKKSLADFVDVFCDKGFFSNEEAEKIFLAAKALGFKIRMHGDELADTGGAELAARLGALSVDHLLCVSTKSIAALAKSSTVGILLPGTSLFLREPPAPARKLIDSGVAVALATDFNPGTCPTQNLPLIASLGALQLGMTTAEIVASITWNAARSLGKANSFGALLAGFQAEPVFSNGDDPAAIYYELAPAQLPLPPRL
jgi:imidazolonepropionase